MKDRSRLNLSVAILLAILLVASSVVVVFAEFVLTPPGSIKQYSWDPSIGGGAPKWTNGQNPGYCEGETAAMTAELTGEAGNTYDLPICMQVWELPAPPTKAYGFTAFAPFNTTTRTPNLPPPALPGGEAIDPALPNPPWDTTHPFVYGYNMTINYVSDPVVGLPNCNENEIGVVVNYTPIVDSGAYIVWGGHVAAPGDPLPAGSPDATVPVGKSASYITGNFQARLRTAAADKTLPFSVECGPTAVDLASFTADIQSDHVLVAWETVSETDNLGFNVYRSDTADGARSLISPTMIPTNNPGATQGSTYSFEDSDVQAGETYYYWLEDLETTGKATLNGPVAVTFLGPTSVGLNSFTAVASAAPALLGLSGIAMAALAGLAVTRRKQD